MYALYSYPRQVPRSESSPYRAVMAFARDVGELQSLSGVDLKLIALTHTLEKAAHGDMHLRSSAPTPKVHAKAHKSAGKLLGWGTEGADWDALDQATEDQPAGTYSHRNAQGFRIKALCMPFLGKESMMNTCRSMTPSGALCKDAHVLRKPFCQWDHGCCRGGTGEPHQG